MLDGKRLVCFTFIMTKTEAFQIFKSYTAMAQALGVTKSAVSQWPEDLDQAQTDRVIGAALRLGLISPHDMPAGTSPPQEDTERPKVQRRRAP